jgi:HK97 family phage major capsid protein
VNRGVNTARRPPAGEPVEVEQPDDPRNGEPLTMATNTDRYLELMSEVLKKGRRIRDIKDAAAIEKRDLSRRERAELETLREELDEITSSLPKSQRFDPRFAQGTSRGHHDDGGESAVALKPEQRVTSWLAERGLAGPSGGHLGGGQLSLGKMVRGAITGEWREAEAERRALSESVVADGGYLLGPELAGTVIDRMRNAMRVVQAGATTCPMQTSELFMARLATGSTVAWHSEGDAISSSDMGFERITFQAKTLPIIVKISMELFEDLSEEANTTIEHEIAMALSLELDRVALRGSGLDPEPTGILYQDNVTITELGTGDGAAPTWDDLVDGVATVRDYNAEPNAMIFSSRSAKGLDKLKDSTGRYLAPPPGIAQIARLTSNQVPNDLTVGSSSDCSEIYIGDWSNVLLGIRTDMRFQIRVLNERFIDAGQYGLLAYLRADVQLAHPTAFNVLTGVLPIGS